MSGRPSAVARGYLPSYMPFAFIDGMDIVGDELLLHVELVVL